MVPLDPCDDPSNPAGIPLDEKNDFSNAKYFLNSGKPCRISVVN